MNDEHNNNLTIRFIETDLTVTPTDALTFGRDADLVVDPDNRHMHRRLGRFSCADDGNWFLANIGRTVALLVTDLDGASYARLVPGSEMPLPYVNNRISFSAGECNYRLDAHRPTTSAIVDEIKAPSADNAVPDPLATVTIGDMVFNDEQWALLCALAAPRLAGPADFVNFPSNREIADRLGWSITKYNRKLDHLCQKFERAGLKGLVAGESRSAQRRRLVLANHVVEQGIVTAEHVRR